MKKILFSVVAFSLLLMPLTQINAQEDMMESHDEMMEMVELMENGQLDAESQEKLVEHVNYLVDEMLEEEMENEDMMNSYHFGPSGFMSTSPFFQVLHVLFVILILSLLTMLNVLTYKSIKKKK